ncbi:hypothetical protein ACQY0O_004309 [Thecaphora frezii]
MLEPRSIQEPGGIASLQPVPPYNLEPLLYPALPPDDASTSPDPRSPAGLAQLHSKAVRCAEGDGGNLYIGTSDGVIHAYTIIVPPQGTSRSSRPRYRLRTSRLISNNARPVEKILLLASLPLAAVLCEGVLSFYTLPDWVPARGLPSTRAVSTVVLDDDEVLNNGGVDGAGMVSLCILRRKNILLAKVGQSEHRDPAWAVIKDIPLPGGAIVARRYGDALCIANTVEYSLVDLSNGFVTQLHLPISQTGESPSAQVRPSIVSIPLVQNAGSSPSSARASTTDAPQCEFLVTSHSGSITLGVFVTPSGEPMPKLLEWPSHPRSVVYASNYLFSLLRNNTVEVHDVRSDVMEKVQTQHLPPGVEPRFLTLTAAAAAAAPSSDQPDGVFDDLDIIKLDLDAPSTSSLLRRQEASALARVGVQVTLCGRNSVHSIEQDSLLDWGSKLLRKGQLIVLEEGLRTVQGQLQDQQRAQEAEVLRRRWSEYGLLLQALTVEYLRRARFWNAGETFCKSGGDPRLLIALFQRSNNDRAEPPDRQRDASSTDLLDKGMEAIVPAALRAHVELLYDEQSRGLHDINALILNNLVLNYCPPLDVAMDPILRSLAGSLTKRASDMLLKVLRTWRGLAAAFREEPAAAGLWAGQVMDDKMRQRVAAIVDSTLLRVLAERSATSGDASELEDLLEADLACPPDEVTSILKQQSYVVMLAKVYEKQQMWDEVLDIWIKIIDGKLIDRGPGRDDEQKHPVVNDVANLLSSLQDPTLTSKYGTWLVRRDPEVGVRILTQRVESATASGGGTTRNTRDKELAAIEGHRATLAEISAIDANAADDFVENVVLAATKIQDAEMHGRLFSVLIRKVEQHLSDAEIRSRHKRIAVDYAEGSFAESFYAHLALAASSHPGDLHRLKLVMLLQGSSVLELDKTLEAVSRNDIFVYERAVVLGKLGRDREALKLLAIELRDANSAETYCSQDGAVLSPMLANSVAQDFVTLEPYAAMVTRTHQQRSRAAIKSAQKDVTQMRHRKEGLLKTLLQIYMENGSDQTFRTATAHLLNTQALHLDSLDILQLVPDVWSLLTLKTFLSQSLRRQKHRQAEAELTRSIAVCREFDVAEKTWARLREMGGVLQDTDEDGGGEDQDGQETVVDEAGRASSEGSMAEKGSNDKSIVIAPPPPASEVHDLATDKLTLTPSGLHD